jgi:hypothetical protein
LHEGIHGGLILGVHQGVTSVKAQVKQVFAAYDGGNPAMMALWVLAVIKGTIGEVRKMGGRLVIVIAVTS